MAPLQIPGYHFDGKKYYKISKGGGTPIIPTAPVVAHDPTPKLPASEHRRKKRRTKEKGKEKAVEPSASTLRGMFDGHRNQGERFRWKHQVDSLALSRINLSRRISPDCLPMSDNITCVSFDDTDPCKVRIGASSGSVASGTLNRIRDNPYASYPNDELGWRTGWYLPSPVTSIQTSGDRILITCLTQAIVGTKSDSISQASVTLSPRETSVWSSVLTPEIVALGCDQKVLVTRDPTKSLMAAYVTGGKGGGGAVFSLAVQESSVFAGTRSGKIKVFDLRSSPTATENNNRAAESRAEINFRINSSVTHVKPLDVGTLVAGMDGSLAIYDLRFPGPKPLLSLSGHFNSFTRDVGLDILGQQFVAVAGQDGKIRLWSLLTGQQITRSHANLSLTFPGSSLQDTTWSSPITALTFTSVDYDFSDNERLLSRTSLERRDGKSMGSTKLWVGSGTELECFEI